MGFNCVVTPHFFFFYQLFKEESGLREEVFFFLPFKDLNRKSQVTGTFECLYCLISVAMLW